MGFYQFVPKKTCLRKDIIWFKTLQFIRYIKQTSVNSVVMNKKLNHSCLQIERLVH